MTEQKKAVLYWTNQYNMALKARNGAEARLKAEPKNPWYITELKAREERLAECEGKLLKARRAIA